VTDAVVMRDVAVVGGGCYGTFYAGQLAKAKERGKARFRRVVVVDRDPSCRARLELGETPDRVFVAREWDDYFAELLGGAAPAAAGEPQDYIVPGEPGTPYDRTGPDRTRYVSFADWICPTHCIEPAVCPAIGSARTWEMGDAVRGLTERLRAAGEPVHGPALFVCRHHVFGVGTFAVDAVLAGDALVRAAGESGSAAEVLVGTISSCHGAVNLLRIGAAEGGKGRQKAAEAARGRR